MPTSVVAAPSFQCTCHHALRSRHSPVAQQHSPVFFNSHFQLRLQRNFAQRLVQFPCRPKLSCLISSCRSHEKPDRQEISCSSPASALSTLPLSSRAAGCLGVLLGSGASFALSFGRGNALAAEEASTTQGGVGEPTDYLLLFLFGAAFVGLAVLTAGVIYLSVSDFLEKRKLTELQKTVKEEKFENNETVKVGPKGFGPAKKVEKGK